MSLAEQIETDFKNAMKAKETEKLSTLRMLKAALSNKEMEGEDQLKDADVVDVIRKMVKQHQESIEAFKKGDRPEMAQKEAAEAETLKTYLPPEMDDAKLKEIVDGVIQELGVSGPQAMGQVMKGVMAKAAGQADGKKISSFVKEALG